MKVSAAAIFAFKTAFIWWFAVSAAAACNIEESGFKDEYTRSIVDVCNANRVDFEGAFVFVESGLWPVPNYFVLRVNTSPDLNFSSMDILAGADPEKILRGSLRISTRTETKYDGYSMLVESAAIEVLSEVCDVDASLYKYEVELPLGGQRIKIFELSVNSTILAIRDFDQRMIDAMALAFVRLNCD